MCTIIEEEGTTLINPIQEVRSLSPDLYLEVGHLLGEKEHLLRAADVDVEGSAYLLVKADRGSAVEHDRHLLREQLSVVSGQGESRG